MGEFSRRAGQTLGLSLDLRPTPDVTRFVTAFLFDKDGNALAPASVNLTDQGNGNHVENSTTMQSVPQMRAKYRVFFDAGRTDEDDCEYLGGEDVFDLDDLQPSELPGDSKLTGVLQSQVTIKGEIADGDLSGEIKTDKLSGQVQDPDALEGKDEASKLDAEINSEELKGKL